MKPLSALTSLLALSSLPAAAVGYTASADGYAQFTGLGVTFEDSEPSIRTSTSGPSNVRRGIFEFDISSLPDDADILSATLMFTLSGLLSNVGSNPVEVDVWSYTGDGIVTAADYNAAAILAGSEEYPLGSAGVGDTVAISLAELATLEAAVLSADGRITLRTHTFSFATFSVGSLENTNAGYLSPTLEIQYVPEPSFGLLLLLGAAGHIAGRRRG